MATILQLGRQMEVEPLVVPGAGVTIRTFGEAADTGRWLKLRDQAFAGESPQPGPWTEADFRREFLDRWWWRPERMWLAFGNPEPESARSELMGSVTLMRRGTRQLSQPAVHWLMVRPDKRRQGIGEVLMSHLEHACWEAGEPLVVLETHARWEAAVRFYRAIGYREGRGRSIDFG